MADPVWMYQVIKDAGVSVSEYPGCYDRGHGDCWTITHVIDHHTGAPVGSNPGPFLIANHPSLGLCSQIHLARDGHATICGVGIAWHAGNGSWPGLPTNNANPVTIGIEAENSGTEGWSAEQYWAYVRINAALLTKLGVPASHSIGHKEWAGPSQGKWDPGGMNMDKFRADIAEVMAHGSNVPVVRNEIDHTRSFSGWLGDRVFEGERVCADGVGRYADFANGSIYWHPDTGSLPVPANVYETWAAQQWEQGELGYPTRYHVVCEDQGEPVGDVQEFQGGTIARQYGHAGHIAHGVIGGRWRAEGDVRGPLGWPTSNEYDTPEGGRRQDFTGGSLVWHPSGAIKLEAVK